MDQRELNLLTAVGEEYSPQEETKRNLKLGLREVFINKDGFDNKTDSSFLPYSPSGKIGINMGEVYIMGHCINYPYFHLFEAPLNKKSLFYIAIDTTSDGKGFAVLDYIVNQYGKDAAIRELDDSYKNWNFETNTGKWYIPIAYAETDINGESVIEDLRSFETEKKPLEVVTVRPSAAPFVSPGKTFDMGLTLEEARGKTFMGSMFNNTSILNETLVGVCLPEIGDTIRLKGAYSSGTNGQAYCLIELEYVAGTTWKIASATVTYSFNINAGLVGSLAGLFYKI